MTGYVVAGDLARDCPNLIRAMSLIGGCLTHPELLTRCRTSKAAPHAMQLAPVGSLAVRQ